MSDRDLFDAVARKTGEDSREIACRGNPGVAADCVVSRGPSPADATACGFAFRVRLRRILLERQLLDIQFESELLFERGVVPSPGAGQPPSPCIAKTVESLHETCFSGETYHLQ
jgi:hypothetical protein